MKSRNLVTLTVLLALANTAAAAQSAPPSTPTFIYQIARSGAGGPSSTMSLDVAVLSTQPDGTRKASLVVHAPKMPVDNQRIDATISPSGSFSLASTGTMPQHFNPFSAHDIKAAQQTSVGPMVQMMIGPINAFASAFANAPASLKTGATWHAFSYETGGDVIYTVTGNEQRNGRDTIALSMKSAGASTTGATVSGQGLYDATGHVVVAVHSEMRQSASANVMQMVDVALKTP